MENIPHLGIRVPEDFPDQLTDKYQKELEHPLLRLEIRKFPLGGPYASMEWAIPTAIGLYILKGYFEGFLNEAGKDHYNLFKEWTKKLANTARAIKVYTIVAATSTQKLTSTNPQSKGFSIETKTQTGNQLKFLFDESLSENEWDVALDKLFELLENHFNEYPHDHLTKKFVKANMQKQVFGRIKSENLEWEFIDLEMLIKEKIKQ